MTYLVDTNLLLRFSQPAHSMNSIVVNAIETLLSRGEEVCICPQNMIEFWAVATRPIANNGLGLSITDTIQKLVDFKDTLTFKFDPPEVYTHWEILAQAHSVSGKQVHDARLVAVMIAHGITHLLTFNGNDFKRYPITVVDPSTIQPQP